MRLVVAWQAIIVTVINGHYAACVVLELVSRGLSFAATDAQLFCAVPSQ
jgi:hypothetical protein